MSESEKINVGDVVQLKSGGPQMTVSGFSNVNGDAICQWFHNGNPNRGSYPANALKKTE